MTTTQAREILTADEIQDAETVGAAWGEQEVECWKDQHDGSFDRAPDWTLGTFCGLNPHAVNDEKATAWEEIVDAAARKVWNDARHRTDAATHYGDLMDYATGDYLRPATKEEREASDREVADGHHEGVIPVDWRSEGGWNGEDYRNCWVQP